MNNSQSDRELIRKWKAGDGRGFSELYERYRARIFGFLLRMTGDKERAEDLMQDTFVAALRNLDQFDERRSFLSWMFGIAHKRTIDFFRHAKVETEHEDDAGGSIGSKLESPDDSFLNKQTRGMIWEAVDKLDPLQREVFLLRELGDVPFKDIAEIMNCPINTALGRMRLALKNIRKELEKRGVYGVR